MGRAASALVDHESVDVTYAIAVAALDLERVGDIRLHEQQRRGVGGHIGLSLVALQPSVPRHGSAIAA